MAFDWISVIKIIPDLVGNLGGLVKYNRATKDALIRELRLNIKAFNTAFKNKKIDYDKLIDLLQNDAIKTARKSRFTFNSIKAQSIKQQDIRDSRNLRYIDKDCDWLFKNIDEKIEDLRIQKQYNNSLNQLENSNISLQFSNLFFKMKLLADFIS